MENNFRGINDQKINCMYCVEFYSYAAKYEDELEPYDFGECSSDDMSMEFDEIVGEHSICDLYKDMRNKKPSPPEKPPGRTIKNVKI